MGLEGLDMVRIEAGLIFYGYEFNDQTDPFEAGIGFSVALKTKEDDFIGKDALIKRKESPQEWISTLCIGYLTFRFTFLPLKTENCVIW